MSEDKTQSYDDVPVVYCANCYSLNIQYEETIDSDCCMECGCLTQLESNIHEWEKKYQERYGHKFVVKNDNPRKTKIFNLSPGELKMMVYDYPEYQKIIHDIYPNFTGGFSRADTIILFFDKLSKDRKMDELRTLLTNKYKS